MEATAADAASAFTPRRGGIASVQHLLHRYPTVSPAAVLLTASIAFKFLSDGKFDRWTTLGIILQQTAVMAALAIGQTLIVLTAGVDLGVGTGMVLTHLVVAKVFGEWGVPGFLALLIGLLVGLALGAFHGFLVTKVGLPPFITTLGTFYIFQSLGLVYSKARTIPKTDLGDNPATKGFDGLLLWTGKELTLLGTRQKGLTITVGVLLVLLMYVVFSYVLSSTAWGSHVYATGDDLEAARLAGIDVSRVLVSVYMVAGALYAFGAWIQLGRSLSASSNAAVDVNLETITAVVIGGTSLFGGRGRLSGTLIGALIVTVFRLGLTLSGVETYWQTFAIGALILVAVGLDQWIRKVAK